jgi:predicted ribonuclease YlaK
MEKKEVVEKLWVLPDTNVFLVDPAVLDEYNIVVLGCVLRELENHKVSHRAELAYQARIATRYIKNREKNSYRFIGQDYDAENILGKDYHNAYFDNQIIAACRELCVPLTSHDVLLQFKAKSFDVDVIELDEIQENDVSKYTGIRELFLSDSDEDVKLLANIYENPESNTLELAQNEYLLLWNKDMRTYNDDGEENGFELIDVLRFDGFKLTKLKYKPTEDLFMGKTKPINIKQRIAFDLLQNKDIGVSLVTGSAGSGKDYVMAAHMMHALQREEIDKIVFIRNIAPLADAGQTGYLKGDLFEKLSVWAYPLMDAIGGQDAFEMLYDKGKIEIQHFESIRGRSFKNCGVYVTEIQNMTSSHARMLLSRVGDGSFIFLNGDTKQTDKDVFKNNSAINTLKKLKGHRLFGMVEFDKIERSDIASLSEFI